MTTPLNYMSDSDGWLWCSCAVCLWTSGPFVSEQDVMAEMLDHDCPGEHMNAAGGMS